jgi:methyl-accepting chemotaxis protein
MKISLGFKLTVIFLLILVIGLGTTSYFSYQDTSNSLIDITTEELESISDLKEDQIADYFKEIKGSVEYLSDSQMLKKELPNIVAGYNKGIESADYKQAVEKINDGVGYFIESESWNDIYMIDPSGNVVYSSDDGADNNTNLKTGPYKKSSLATAYQQGKEKLSFVDFSYYEPSNTKVGFVAAPISNDSDIEGVVVVEFSANKINEIMQRESGLGEHGESYLVGPDHLMRSNTKFLDEDTLGSKLIENDYVEQVLDGKAGVENYVNYRNVEVLGSYIPVDVFGENWGLVVEAEKDKVMKPVSDLLSKMLLIAAITIIVAVIITAIFVKFMISNPVYKVRDVLSSLSEEDLTKRVDHSTNDELGKMSRDLNKTIEKLNSTIKKIRDIVTNVRTASEDLADGNKDLSSRTQDTASSLEEISATIEEISASMEEIASHANTVNQLSEDNLRAIKKGADIIDDTKEEIEAMDNLSSKISDIIVIINDIAAQTKLLSMNAAIEAAKADKNGQGFAVVASEVGQLADQTSDSAKQINGLIQNIINGINESSEEIKVVDEMFDQIVENSSKVYQGINEISASTEEQSSAVEQMQEALEELNLGTQQNTGLVEQIAESSEDLNQDAEKMDQLVNKFKLSEKNNLLDLLKQGNLEDVDDQDFNLSLEQLKNLDI